MADTKAGDNKPMEDDQTFEKTTSGASTTFPQQCSSLRKNGHVMIKGHPCKIVDMSTSKTGKHGHAKVHLVGVDIFTQKKYEDLCPSTHNMDVPNVQRAEYTYIDLDDDFFSVMDDKMESKSDLKLPEDKEKADEIRTKLSQLEAEGADIAVCTLAAVGIEVVVDVKKQTK